MNSKDPYFGILIKEYYTKDEENNNPNHKRNKNKIKESYTLLPQKELVRSKNKLKLESHKIDHQTINIEEAYGKRSKSAESLATPDKNSTGKFTTNPSQDFQTIMTLWEDESRVKLLQ